MQVCAATAYIDCNATVAGNTFVPVGMKACAGEVFKGEAPKFEDFFIKSMTNQPHIPTPVNGKVYNFGDVM